MWVIGEWSVGQWIVGVISFQKMYGLYGLKHHTTEINGDVTMETNELQSENRASHQIDKGLLDCRLLQCPLIGIHVLFRQCVNK